MKRQLRGFVIGATIFSTLLSPFGGTEVRADSGENSETEQKEKQQEKTEIRPQDDFFGYVNADALKNAEIDPKYGFGAFEEWKDDHRQRSNGVIRMYETFSQNP